MSTVYPKEQVLVIPANLAESLCNYQSFAPAGLSVEKTILGSYTFLEREIAEQSFDFKQVIPYVVVTNTDNTRWLLSQRTSQQQETRLHNKFSIGQGGHINNLDFGGGQSPIVNGMMREINEEFSLEDIRECVPFGLINDNSNEVGRVHFGLVYMLRVGSSKFHVAEQGKHIAQWATLEELEARYEQMEHWSQIVMDRIIRRWAGSR